MLLLNIINLGLQRVSIGCVDALHRHRYLLSSAYKNVLSFAKLENKLLGGSGSTINHTAWHIGI